MLIILRHCYNNSITFFRFGEANLVFVRLRIDVQRLHLVLISVFHLRSVIAIPCCSVGRLIHTSHSAVGSKSSGIQNQYAVNKSIRRKSLSIIVIILFTSRVVEKIV